MKEASEKTLICAENTLFVPVIQWRQLKMPN